MTYEDFLQHQHPFLTGMCESHPRQIAGSARDVHFAAGTPLFREGDSADHLFLILRGKVVLQTHSAGRALPIETIDPGEVLGWSWLFPPYCWHFDTRAEEDTDAISFPAEQLRKDSEADKSFGYALMKKVASLLIHRLQATRRKLVQSEMARPRGPLLPEG